MNGKELFYAAEIPQNDWPGINEGIWEICDHCAKQHDGTNWSVDLNQCIVIHIPYMNKRFLIYYPCARYWGETVLEDIR